LAAGGENAEAETPPAPVVDAIAELRARGLDLAAMNHARFSSGLPTISAEQALARLDAARVVNAAVRGAVAAQPACRVCKCTDDDCSQCIAKTGSPCRWVEPDLCSACASEPPNHPNTPENEPAAPIRFTYVDGIDAARDERLRADGFEPVQSSPEAIELTDELREYAREQLHYLAPELQSARDRAILAAYDAEETARTTSPDTWLGGER
jgi:hypothetical protein